MKMSLDKNDLVDYVANQLNIFFLDKNPIDSGEVKKYLDLALQRVEYCFSWINSKYYNDGSNTLFNHLHADHYAVFLYLLSNTLYRNNADLAVCAKVFQLNRYLHSIDVYYEVELPDIFLFSHPLGAVLGRARYSNFFRVAQQCTVGNNKNVYPTLEEHVSLYPGSAILGNCVVKENCKIAAGSLLLDRNLEKNSLYIGNPAGFTVRESREKDPIWR